SALEDFKSSGKFIHSYAEYMAEGNYYVASVADEIYLNPIGVLEFNGLSMNVTFLKGLFDKLGIEAQIFRVGDYKSAVEPFMRKNMSDANREQLSALMQDVFGNYISDIAESRSLPVDVVKNISNQMLIREPEDAVTHGLITQVAYENEVKDNLKSLMGIDSNNNLNFYRIEHYINGLQSGYSSDRIAVIVAEGEIVGGSGDLDNVGSEKFVKAIRKARESKRVKAVVIRINSPGGSMLASDVMWKEIMLTKAVKPVIASMSAVAASGGYYMAMPCDTIVAQPMTITGSIGVFGMLPNFEGLLEDKLGITNDQVSTGEFSNIYRVSSGLSDAEKQIIQNSVEEAYETFISKAAEGRNMNVSDLKAVASGRVWTGNQAQARGLVDILGSYQDAVTLAAENANIEDDYKVEFYPPLKSKWEELFSDFSEDIESKWVRKEFGEIAKYVEKIKSIEKYEGIQARLPFDLEIQ
ncbi:MAG: signal peptide peptidase SppA, partial [Pseudomonadota bacterium]